MNSALAPDRKVVPLIPVIEKPRCCADYCPRRGLRSDKQAIPVLCGAFRPNCDAEALNPAPRLPMSPAPRPKPALSRLPSSILDKRSGRDNWNTSELVQCE